MSKKDLIEGIHYYIDKETGYFVFTENYHMERGYCCKSKTGCRHCPYGHLGKIKN